MKETGLYDELGIAPDATEQQIRSAYRSKALQYHPDKNNGDPAAAEKFKKVAEAYEILSDADRRRQYDTFGRNGPAGAAGGAGGFPAGGFGPGMDPMDIFSSFFGFANGAGQQRQQRQAKPSFILVELQCSLEELYCGTTKVLEVQRRRLCAACRGHGTSDGRPCPLCPACKGNKTVMKTVQFGGFTTFQQCRCERCQGAGKLPIRSACTRCAAGYEAYQASGRKTDPLTRGVLVEKKSIKVTIAPGTEDSDAINFAGQGDELPGFEAPGDILVVMEQLPHPHYRRLNSTDLFLSNCRVPLWCLFNNSFAIPIELLDGRVIRLAPPRREGGAPSFLFDSQHVFVVENEGMPEKQQQGATAAAAASASSSVAHLRKGKLYVCVDVVFPGALTPAQADAVTAVLASAPLRGGGGSGGGGAAAALNAREVTLQPHHGPAPSWHTVDEAGNASYTPGAPGAAKKKRRATAAAASAS